MPLEALVRVHHEQVGGKSQLLGVDAASERRRDGTVVQQLSERAVGRPHRPLDVIVQPRRHARDRPEVRVPHLPVGRGPG
eukprot:4214748-Prymnesium_polylepis.1